MLSAALLAAPAARALDASPESFQLTARPGGKAAGEITLVNDSAEPIRVTVGLVPDRKDGGEAWLMPSKTDFKLAAGARRTVRFSGRAPQGAAEWSGRVVVRGRELRRDAWYEVRLSRPVRVRVPSLEKPAAALEVTARRDGPDVLIEGVFRNQGNVSLRPRFLAEAQGAPSPARSDAAHAVPPSGTAPVAFRFPAASGKAVTVSAFYPAPAGDVRVVRRAFPAEDVK